MHKTLSDLLTTIDQETACYAALEKVLAEEKETLSLSKKEQFENVQLRKEVLVEKLQGYENRRKPLVEELAGICGQQSGPLTVKQLASLIDPPEDDRLLQKADRLRSAIAVVQKKNRHNRALIHHYLGLVGCALNLLTHHLGDSAVYQKGGRFAPMTGYGRSVGRLIRGSA